MPKMGELVYKQSIMTRTGDMRVIVYETTSWRRNCANELTSELEKFKLSKPNLISRRTISEKFISHVNLKHLSPLPFRLWRKEKTA